MRVLVAVDKFKGSLRGVEVGEAVARGLRAALGKAAEGWQWDVCPLADGGEGLTEAVTAALGGDWVETGVVDAVGRPARARYGITRAAGDGGGEGGAAVMEMSAASGLAMVAYAPPNPWEASTFGTGQMMLDAARRGAGRILMGIGGSATNDGGAGMALALGFRFLDEAGVALTRLPLDLPRLRTIVPPDALPLPPVEVACDVGNPLLGPRGCTRVYGPQKGVAGADMAAFEDALGRLAAVVFRDLGVDAASLPGAGAAGGLGFGLVAFCGARLRPGFDLVADLTGLRGRIEEADAVITGEGRLDRQTLHGKGPVGVARMARALGRPVAAVAGSIESGCGLEGEFDAMVATKPEDMPLEEALRRGAGLVEESVAALAGPLMEWSRAAR